MALLPPLTAQDTQLLSLLKPYLTLKGQTLVDGMLTLAWLSNRELRTELSPVPVLQLLGLLQTRSKLQAERARAQALGLVKEGQYMPPQPLDSKDVSLILAIRPFLSEKSQTLVDTLVNLLSVISAPPERKIDPEALANLINLIAQANAPQAKDDLDYAKIRSPHSRFFVANGAGSGFR